MLYQYDIEGPDGKVYTIEGPEGASDAQLIATLKSHLDQKNTQMGFIDSAKDAAKTALGLPKALKFGQEDTPKNRAAVLKAREPEGARMSWAQAETPGDYVDWAKQNLGTTLGYMATPAAVGTAARMVAGASPIGRAAGLVGAVGTLGAQYVTDNLGRQAENQQIDVEAGRKPTPANLGRAALAAAGQTGLDIFALKPLMPLLSRTPFVRALVGAEGQVAEKQAAKALQSYVSGAAEGAAKTAMFEIPTEIGQQALERWQTGLPLDGDDAKREYLEAFAGAALMGGTLGSLSGAVDVRAARSGEEQKQLAAAQAEAEAEAARNPPPPPAGGPPPPPSATNPPIPPNWPTPAAGVTATPQLRKPPISEGAASAAATLVAARNKPQTIVPPGAAPSEPAVTEDKLNKALVYASAKDLITQSLSDGGEGKSSAVYIQQKLKIPLSAAKEIRQQLIKDGILDPKVNRLVAPKVETPPVPEATTPPPSAVKPLEVTSDNFSLALQYVQQRGKASAADIKAQFDITLSEAKALRDRMIAEGVINKSGKLITGKPDAQQSIDATKPDDGADRTSPVVPVPPEAAKPAVAEEAQSVGVGGTGGVTGNADGRAQADSAALKPTVAETLTKESITEEKPAAKYEAPKVRTKVLELPFSWKVFHDTDNTFSYETAKGEKAVGFPIESAAADAAAARAAGKFTPAAEIEQVQRLRAEKQAEKAEQSEIKRKEKEAAQGIVPEETDEEVMAMEEVPETQALPVEEAMKLEEEVNAEVDATPKKSRSRKTPEQKAQAEYDAKLRERKKKRVEAAKSRTKKTVVRLYRVEPSGDPTSYRSTADWMALQEKEGYMRRESDVKTSVKLNEKDGKYHARVSKQGVEAKKEVFDTQQEADQWVNKTKAEFGDSANPAIAITGASKQFMQQNGVWFTDSYDDAMRTLQEQYPDGTITAVDVTADAADALRVSALSGRGRWRGVKRSHRQAVRDALARRQGFSAPKFPTDPEKEVYVPKHVAAKRSLKIEKSKEETVPPKKLLMLAHRYYVKHGLITADESARFMAEVSGSDQKTSLAKGQKILDVVAERQAAKDDADNVDEGDITTSLDDLAKAEEETGLQSMNSDDFEWSDAYTTTRYSRGASTTGTGTVETVTEAVKLAFGTSGNTLLKSGRIRIVQHVSELPGKGHPEDVKGMFDGKTAYLVADNLNTDNIKQTVLHEVGVHMGMKNLLGQDLYDNLVGMILQKSRANPESVYGAATRVALASVGENATDDQIADEMLGYLVEAAPETSLVQKIFSVIKLAIHKLFNGRFGDLSQADLVVMAMAAIKREAILADPIIKSTTDANGRQIHATSVGIRNFWKWFGNSVMTDDQGRPLVLYHGTPSLTDYTEFRTGGHGISTWLGIHVAPDAEISNAFTRINSVSYSGESEPKYVPMGRVMPLYVRAKNLLDLTQQYDDKRKVYKNRSVKQASLSDDAHVAAEIAHRAMTPEFLAVILRERWFFQKATNSFTENLQLKKAARILDEWNAGKVAKLPHSTDPDLQNEYSKDDFIAVNMNNSLTERSPEYLRAAQDMMKKFIRESGYDGIKYVNTSEVETGGAKDNTSYIIFDRTSLKSATGNVGAFSATDPDIRYSRSFMDSSRAIWNNFSNGVNSLPKEPTGNFNERFVGTLSTLPDELRSFAFGMLSLPQIADVMGKQFPTINKLVVNLQKRASTLSARKEHVDKTFGAFDVLRQKYAALMPDFFDIAHKTTLDQIDVLDSKNAADPLTQRFNALPKELQDAYKTLRAEYKSYGDKLIDIVANMAGATAAKQLRAKFEQKRLGVYLPLLRMGDYWLSYIDSTNEQVSMAFNSPHERNLAKAYAKGKGGKEFREFARLSQANYKTAPSMGFMGDILKILRDSDEIQKVRSNFTDPVAGEEAVDAVINQVYQSFLSYMPAESIRQQFHQREGRLGFMPDAFQVYATVAKRMADQLSNMEFATPIEENLAALHEEFEQTPTMTSRAALENIKRQVEFIRNPVAGKIATKASYFSYLWFIAANVSSAMVNLTQVPIIVYPLLGGKYGYDKASEALAKATAMYLKGGKDDNSLFLPDWTYGKGKNVSAEHKRLYGAAVERTAIRRSTGYEITEAQKLDYKNYNGVRAKVDHALGYIFQNSERANREITLLAAYDLARSRGVKEDQAIEEALALVNDAHGVALAEIGPRHFQQGVGKVMFTFKRFAQAQIYLLYRLFKEATKGESQLVRDAARRQLLGVYAMTFAFAGIQGMPLYGAAAMLAKLLMDDDDDPYDPDEEVRQAFGNLGYKGPINQMLGVDIASRTGFNSLIWRDDPKRLADMGYLHYAAEILGGPAVGAAMGVERGIKMMQMGEYQRGLENMLPAAIRNGMKSVRFATEGATTLNGVPIVDDISAYNNFMQTFGFNPAELAEARMQAGSLQKQKDRIIQRRSSLLDKLDAARVNGDVEEFNEIMQSIRRFNTKNPMYPITLETIRRSYKQRRVREQQMVSGVHVPDWQRVRRGMEDRG